MRIALPEEKKLVYSAQLPIRWGDMDAMGHVNNTVYFRYMETLRIDWFYSLKATPAAGGVGPVIVNAFCNFVRQLRYPGTVVAHLYTANPGRSSFDTFTRIEREDEPGVVYAEGGATTVWLDYAADKALPLPTWLRELVTP